MLKYWKLCQYYSNCNRIIINTSFRRNGSGRGGGTVKNSDGIFSEREAAFENRYFRERDFEALRKLREETHGRMRDEHEKADKNDKKNPK